MNPTHRRLVETTLTLATVGPLLLLMRSNVRVEAHTPAQVVAGTLFGLIIPQLQLWWIVYRWLDLVG